jgi:hypothetical protein
MEITRTSLARCVDQFRMFLRRSLLDASRVDASRLCDANKRLHARPESAFSRPTDGRVALEVPLSGRLASRSAVAALASSRGGRQLILVRYTPQHATHYDYVFNDANIDSSPIIWARDMGYLANRELIDHYPDRKVWLWQPDISPDTVSPVPRVKTFRSGP